MYFQAVPRDLPPLPEPRRLATADAFALPPAAPLVAERGALAGFKAAPPAKAVRPAPGGRRIHGVRPEALPGINYMGVQLALETQHFAACTERIVPVLCNAVLVSGVPMAIETSAAGPNRLQAQRLPRNLQRLPGQPLRAARTARRTGARRRVAAAAPGGSGSWSSSPCPCWRSCRWCAPSGRLLAPSGWHSFARHHDRHRRLIVFAVHIIAVHIIFFACMF